jgi:predicted NBD/HSP70 family sugar kinase
MTAEQETYLAVDLGGTSLLVGEVNGAGKILSHKKYPSGYIDQKQATEIIKHAVTDFLQTTKHKHSAMGVGLIGRVNNAGGIWLQMDLKRTELTSLAEVLSAHFGMPCYIDNDVKAATRAERIWGCKSENFIYLNIGTGIGAGFIVNGKLMRGSHYNSGEVGHTRVGTNIGIRCGCGREDCVELIAAGIGFDRSARLLSNRFSTSLDIPGDEKRPVDVREVYALYEKGDELCVQLVQNASTAIADLIMNIVRVSDPDTVVLGGGIVSSGFLFPMITEKLNQTTIRFVKNGVVLTRLDPDFIGLIGAAAVATNK